MSYTKLQFIEDAYEEIGMASYVFDLEPETLLKALRRLDALMAAWNELGIRLGYPIPARPQDSDLNELTGVPDRANRVIITNLAMEIAPGHGKTVSPQTVTAAKRGYDMLLSRAAIPSEVQITGLPAGAGSKATSAPFLPGPVETLDAGQDGELTFE